MCYDISKHKQIIVVIFYPDSTTSFIFQIVVSSINDDIIHNRIVSGWMLDLWQPRSKLKLKYMPHFQQLNNIMTISFGLIEINWNDSRMTAGQDRNWIPQIKVILHYEAFSKVFASISASRDDVISNRKSLAIGGIVTQIQVVIEDSSCEMHIDCIEAILVE